MATKWAWMAAAGLPLLLIGGSPAVGRAAQTEPAGQPSAKAEQPAAAVEQPKTTEPTPAKAPEAPAQKAAQESTAKTPQPKPSAVKRPAGLVGKVVAVSPTSHTVVVDVPQGKDTLRIGVEITDQTKILVAGKKASLDTLKEGERVRIVYHRTSTGDVATAVDVLRSSMG